MPNATARGLSVVVMMSLTVAAARDDPIKSSLPLARPTARTPGANAERRRQAWVPATTEGDELHARSSSRSGPRMA